MKNKVDKAVSLFIKVDKEFAKLIGSLSDLNSSEREEFKQKLKQRQKADAEVGRLINPIDLFRELGK